MGRFAVPRGSARLGLALGSFVAVLGALSLAVVLPGSADETPRGETHTASHPTPPPTVLGVAVDRADESPAAPVAPVPTTAAPATTAAPTTTIAAPAPAPPPPPPPVPEPAVPVTATVTADVQGDPSFTRVAVRLVGPDGERRQDLGPEGGRATFADLGSGPYELHLDYEYVPTGPDAEGTSGSAQGIDRSPPFELGPGSALHATWSPSGGWTLVA